MKSNDHTEEINPREVSPWDTPWYEVAVERFEIVQVGDHYSDRRDISEGRYLCFATIDDAKRFFDGIEFTDDDTVIYPHDSLDCYEYKAVRVWKCWWCDEDMDFTEFDDFPALYKESITAEQREKIEKDKRSYWRFLDYED